MRPLSLIAATGAVALASLAVASPAVGAPLPPGQFIDVLQSTFDSEHGVDVTEYWRVDPAEALSTPVNRRFEASDFVGFDLDAQGLGWALQVDSTEGRVPYLVPVNGSTGEVFMADRHQIVPVNPAVVVDACFGITYLPTGELVISCQNEGAAVSFIGVVTIEGAFTPFLTSLDDSVPDVAFEALAWDPVNAQLWAFGNLDDDPGMPRAFLVDREKHTLGTAVTLTEPVISADFDSAGTLWAIVADELATVVPSTGAITLIHPFQTAEHDPVPDVGAIAIRGAEALAEPPVLPATGPEQAAPLGFAAALMMLLGAAFVVTRRRRRVEG